MPQGDMEELPAEQGQEQVPDSGDDKNPFGDEKFDAGIDVDEDVDPKKYIEKLTGKLAQKLRDYNGTEKDIDLNKFVINSLIPAAIPEMGADDAKDVIQKVNDNIGSETQPDVENQEPEAELPQEEAPAEEPEAEMPQMESKKSNKSKIVENESIDELIKRVIGGKSEKKKSGPKNPFKTPIFK